jgi:hypothetical protein
MAGLVPAIHVDARVKHGHDELNKKLCPLNESAFYLPLSSPTNSGCRSNSFSNWMVGPQGSTIPRHSRYLIHQFYLEPLAKYSRRPVHGEQGDRRAIWVEQAVKGGAAGVHALGHFRFA